MTANLASTPFRNLARTPATLTEVAQDGSVQTIGVSDLQDRVAQGAGYLHSLGVKARDRVAIAAENSLQALIAQLSTMHLGATACLINPRLSTDTQHTLLQNLDATLLVSETATALSHGVPNNVSTGSFLNPAGVPRPIFEPNEDDLALIMFTSGSSGVPKGVPIRHSGYVWAFDTMMGLADVMVGKVGFVAAPIFHMNGQLHLFNQLSCGMSVVFFQTFRAELCAKAITEHTIHRVTGVPTMASLLCRTGQVFDTVEQLALGSAPITESAYETFEAAFPKALITNGYGTTETGPVSFSIPRGSHPPRTTLGKLTDGVDIKIEGPRAPEEGRLFIRNKMTLRSYWRAPEVSAKRIDHESWYETGDLIRQDKDGWFYYLGRADDMLQVGAENVQPADVAALLERHPCVHEAIVVGVPHATKHEAPVAFVRADDQFSEDALKAFTLEHGPAYAHPRRIFRLNSWPLGATGKIDTKVLQAQAIELSGVLGG